MPRVNSRVLSVGIVIVATGLLLIAYAAAFSSLCFCAVGPSRCACYGSPWEYVVFYLWFYWGISLWSVGAVTTLVGLSLCAVGQIEGVSFSQAGGSLSLIAALLLILVMLYGVVGLAGFLTNGAICEIQTGQCNPGTSLLLSTLGTAAAALGLGAGVSLMKRRSGRLDVFGLSLEALAGASAFVVGAFFSRDSEGAIYLGAPILELSLFSLLFLKLDKSTSPLRK